ncbi:MAG: dodecin domain-containing protein, partial [Burkholderiales bacterium]
MNAASSKGSVYRVTELIGTSTNSWEEAATNAVET